MSSSTDEASSGTVVAYKTEFGIKYFYIAGAVDHYNVDRYVFRRSKKLVMHRCAKERYFPGVTFEVRH